MIQATFEALGSINEQEAVRLTFSKYTKNSALALSQNLGTKLEGLDERHKLATLWCLSNNALTGAVRAIAVYEQSVFMKTIDCPYRGTESICELACSNIGTISSSIFFPGSIYTLTHPDDGSTGTCIAIARLGDEIQAPSFIDAAPVLGLLSEDEWRWIEGDVQGETWRIGVQVAIDVLGEGAAREILLAASRNEALHFIQDEREPHSASRTIDEVAAVLVDLGHEMGQEGEWVKQGEMAQSWTIVDCPVKGNHPIACLQMEAFLDEIALRMNHSLSCRYRSIIDSMGRCVRVLRIAESSEGHKQETSEGEIDPLRVLLIRLAKGEITIEEYKALKSFLEEEIRDSKTR
jgi:hypothetical protein